MSFKDNDFVKIEMDLYANGKLVQTTDEKKGKKEGIKSENFKPQTLILGKGFVLQALDEDVKKAKNEEKRSLSLSAKEAYGPKKKDLIKTFPKKVFDEQGIKAVPGVTYDFNGMYGTVKSSSGGRAMVDFNNPLAGRDIEIEYKVIGKVEDIKEKLSVIFESVLRIPSNMYKIDVKKDNKLTLAVPEQLAPMKEQLIKSFEEFIPNIKDYSIEIESFKN